MTKHTMMITCDRDKGLWRVAVWQGKKLRDLYVDNIKKPSMVGAVLAGKVVRSMSSQKSAFIDCGLDEKVFVAGHAELKNGDKVFVQITSHPRQGKAFGGKILKNGALCPAPKTWQRALLDIKKQITFANREDHEQCREWMDEKLLPLLQPLSKGPVHPELDDMMDYLLSPSVLIGGEASLVIEQTEALVSIDINGDVGKSPLAINLQAVPEIARQIRLRNLSGIIVVDALKMSNRTDANKLLNALKSATADDHAAVEVFGITRLGLVEMSRARKGPSLAEVMKGAG